MWISTRDTHPSIDDKGRNESMWLYEPDRGIFFGYYVEFGLGEPAEDHEYGDMVGRRFPSHFWTGDSQPDYPPRT